MKLRLKGVYQFRAGFASLWFNVMTSGDPNSTRFLLWIPMLDMVGYLSMLMYYEVAPICRTRGMMAFSTTYKQPEDKMYNKK